MESIYTSNFFISGNKENAVSIARYAPKFYRGVEFKILAPHSKLLRMEDEAEYTYYFKEHLAKLDPYEIAKRLQGKVLLCWEKPGDFCHRRLVAKWIESTTGILVPEWTMPKKDDPQISLF